MKTATLLVALVLLLAFSKLAWAQNESGGGEQKGETAESEVLEPQMQSIGVGALTGQDLGDSGEWAPIVSFTYVDDVTEFQIFGGATITGNKGSLFGAIFNATIFSDFDPVSSEFSWISIGASGAGGKAFKGVQDSKSSMVGGFNIGGGFMSQNDIGFNAHIHYWMPDTEFVIQAMLTFPLK